MRRWRSLYGKRLPEGRIWVTMAVFFLTVHVEKGIQDEKDLKHIKLLLGVIYPPAH